MTPSNGLHWIISTARTKADLTALVHAADDACRLVSGEICSTRREAEIWYTL
jgi:hypothetical protein